MMSSSPASIARGLPPAADGVGNLPPWFLSTLKERCLTRRAHITFNISISWLVQLGRFELPTS
jgi:hypothetical protein